MTVNKPNGNRTARVEMTISAPAHEMRRYSRRGDKRVLT